MNSLWNILGFDILKDTNKKLEKEKKILEEENKINNEIIITLKNENIELKKELKINNEILDNLYTANDKNLLEQYKKKLINLNAYKEKTNTKIITLEKYNKELKNTINQLKETNNKSIK